MADFWSLVGAAEDRTRDRLVQDENSARLAYSVHNITSKGVGQFRIGDPIMFDVSFLQRPVFTTGSSVKKAASSEWLDPLGNVSVWRWKRNTKGHYLGAWVALGVSLARADGAAPTEYPDGISMVHDLVFMGPAFKDLGSRVTVAAQTTGSRSPGFGSV